MAALQLGMFYLRGFRGIFESWDHQFMTCFIEIARERESIINSFLYIFCFWVADFVYASGKDSVMQVTVDDYNTCNTMHPIASWSNGPAAYPLHGFTILYFISGAPGHCAAGEKVTIEVLNAPLPL